VGVPLLAPAVELVAAAANHGQAARGKPMRCGGRTKPAVADWDRDGDLDLLVGDFASGSAEAPVLTPEQEKERDALQAEQQQLGMEFAERFQKAMREAAKEAGQIVPENGPFTPPNDRALQQKIQERAIAMLEADDGAFAKYQARMGEIWKKLQPLTPGSELHGFVWFFAREGTGDPAPVAAPGVAPGAGVPAPGAPPNAAPPAQDSAPAVPAPAPPGGGAPAPGAVPAAAPSAPVPAPPPVPAPRAPCR
jgi:hypothetical protein